MAQLVKNPPAIQETWVQFLGWEDPLEKEMATHCTQQSPERPCQLHSIPHLSEAPWDTFCHKGGVICISEVIAISPGNLDSSLCFFQSSFSHDALYIEVK